MKAISILMIVVGIAIGSGGVLEIRSYPPDTVEFWTGIAAILSSLFSVASGIALWQRPDSANRFVFLAAMTMAAVTAAGTALRVMGIAAAIVGIGGSLVVMTWTATRTRTTII